MTGVRRVLRAPSAWLPIVLSLAALALVVGYVAAFGVTRAVDEGAPARLFQLLLLIVAAGIGLFGARWLPRAPREATGVIALQVLAASVPILAILVAEA